MDAPSPGACNFDAGANSNDGSCDFVSCAGCLDVDACNYDGGAVIAGYCDYPPNSKFRLQWKLLAPRLQCMDYRRMYDACACNFDPFANTDNNTCEFDSCSGCVYPTAENYDPTATRDDGSCLFEGCTDDDFTTYTPQANVLNETWCSNARNRT